MKVLVHNLIVDMEMVLKASKQAWAWEVPVLQEKHGEGRVRLLDTAEIEISKLPIPGEEFVRMANAFGIDSGKQGTNLPYVELAYGRGRSGIAELTKEMNDSVVKDAKPKAKKKAAGKKPKAVVETAAQGGGSPLEF